MAETTTRACFPAPSTPSASLGRGRSRAGLVPQHVSSAMTQDLAWPGSYWRALITVGFPAHPCTQESMRSISTPACVYRCGCPYTQVGFFLLRP